MGIEYIKKKKKELNMTTDELSEKSGVPVGTLNKILAGQTSDPKFETVKAICRALDISLSTLDDFEAKNIGIIEVNHYNDKKQYGRLLKYFSKLNPAGKEKVAEYINDLLESDKYTNNEEK